MPRPLDVTPETMFLGNNSCIGVPGERLLIHVLIH